MDSTELFNILAAKLVFTWDVVDKFKQPHSVHTMPVRGCGPIQTVAAWRQLLKSIKPLRHHASSQHGETKHKTVQNHNSTGFQHCGSTHKRASLNLCQ